MINSLLRRLNKPEYIWRPASIVRRLTAQSAAAAVTSLELPWGLSMEVDTGEVIGQVLRKQSVFEIAVVETIFRLVDAGELVLDVGANVGFMSAALACSHPNVSVIAFEPHPQLFQRLARNVEDWQRQRSDMKGRVRALQTAVSDSVGTATLYVPTAFDRNHGIASLVQRDGGFENPAVEVPCTTLDQVLGSERLAVGLMKIDVEGHEMAALSGARRALKQRRIRDIIFEEHEGVDSEVCRLLSEYGYTLFFLGKLPWGPWLTAPRDAAWAASLSFDSPNFLATLEPARARTRMARRGYSCMRSRRRGVGTGPAWKS